MFHHYYRVYPRFNSYFVEMAHCSHVYNVAFLSLFVFNVFFICYVAMN